MSSVSQSLRASSRRGSNHAPALIDVLHILLCTPLLLIVVAVGREDELKVNIQAHQIIACVIDGCEAQPVEALRVGVGAEALCVYAGR